MVGLEDEPTRCGEICIFEVFGDALGAEGGKPTAAVGMGVHPFRDPALADEFETPRLAIDVAQPHVYAADWRPGRVDFLVDGQLVKSVHQGSGSDARTALSGARTLPADTDEGQIEAEIRDGLVEITVRGGVSGGEPQRIALKDTSSEPSRRRLGRD